MRFYVQRGEAGDGEHPWDRLLSTAESEGVLRNKRFSGRQNTLWTLLETHRRDFWLDSPLKASLTTCRNTSPYLPCCCGPWKKAPKCEEQESEVVSCCCSTNLRSPRAKLFPAILPMVSLPLGMSWLMWKRVVRLLGRTWGVKCYSPQPCDGEQSSGLTTLIREMRGQWF